MKKIVLDCDGVLVNYNHHFGEVYQKTFKKPLKVVNPHAYHATEYWGVKLTKEEKKRFYWAFDKLGWGSMPALRGAVEATQFLKAQGYEIIVVTSMNEQAAPQRAKNLQELNICFDDLYATGRTSKHINPKQEILNHLKPQWFVDDLISNFIGLDSGIKCALIDSGLHGNPNSQLKNTVPHEGIYFSLEHFVKEKFQ